MKKLAICVSVPALILGASSVSAQSFDYDIVWQPVENVGGMTGPDGPQYGGGSVQGTYTVTYEDGTKGSGTLNCVGMDQPPGIFAIHLTCSIADADGGTASSVYGCNFLGERGPETPLGCVGGIQGKEGPFAGRNGGLVMEWYTETDARGAGQWYGNGNGN